MAERQGDPGLDPAADRAIVCLWYDGAAEEAARFYAATLPDSAIRQVHRSPIDYPAGKAGDVLVVMMTLCGIPYILMNGGPEYKPNLTYSLQVHTDTQEETDRLWDALTADGGTAGECGWCQDRWGYSWQITPRALTRGMADPDPAAASRVLQAMMTMSRIDIAAIEAARRGD